MIPGMPSLSERLKGLGVQVGPGQLKPKPSTRSRSVREHLGGDSWPTDYGEAWVIESFHPIDGGDYPAALWADVPLDMLAAWAGEPAVAALDRGAFAFLDTETTGLSGGTGTFAFMVGIGKFEADGFRLAQFFLREPGEEPGQLAAIERFLAGCGALVTFNGKSFDAPVLNTRYGLYQWPTPLEGLPHLDLLHLARRLWRARLESRRLGDLETEILAVERGAEEVPGYLVPQIYLDYLANGDAAPLKGVFYHNTMDVLTMAALMAHMAGLLADPMRAAEHDLDLLSIGKLHEDLGRVEEARELYLACLGRPLEDAIWLDAAQRLSFVFKRAEEWDAAIGLWKAAAGKGEIYAHEELAKFYEHRARELDAAYTWTTAALERVNARGFPVLQRYQWKPELEKRMKRLEEKLARMG